MARTGSRAGSRSLSTWAAALGVAWLAGCGQTTQPGTSEALPLSDTLDTATATSAVVSGTGLLRLTVPNPVRAATQVSLTSSDPAIAAVPATATLVAGSDTVDVVFEGKAPGYATLTAELGASRQTALVSVVPAVALLGVSRPARPLAIGASTTTSVSLNLVAPAPVEVALTSSNPAVLAVPASATVSAFSSFATVVLTARAAGSARVTARIDSQVREVNVEVVATPHLTNAYLSPSSLLTPGSTAMLTVELNASVPAGTTLTIENSDPTVARVATTVQPEVGAFWVDTPVEALANGKTTFSLQLGTSTRDLSVTVGGAPRLSYIQPSPSAPIVLGTPSALLVALDGYAAADQVVTLGSTDTDVVALPPTVVVPQGRSYAIIPMDVTSVGTSLLTATLGGVTVGSVLTVVGASTLSSVYFSYPRMVVGASQLMQVVLTAAVATETTVSVLSSNPAVVAVPAAVSIGAGSNYALVPMRAQSPGTSTLRVSVGTEAYSVPITVVAAPALLAAVASGVSVSQSGMVTVSLDAMVAHDTVVSLSQATVSGGVLQMPPNVVIPSGKWRGSVPVIGLSAGGLALTATLGSVSINASMTVQP